MEEAAHITVPQGGAERHQVRRPLPLYATVEQGICNAKAHLFILSARLAIDTALGGKLFASEGVREERRQALFAKLYSLCVELFQKPNCTVQGSNEEIKIVLFSKHAVDERLLQFHIAQSFATIVGNEAAQRLVLMQLGDAPTTHDVFSFLQQG